MRAAGLVALLLLAGCAGSFDSPNSYGSGSGPGSAPAGSPGPAPPPVVAPTPAPTPAAPMTPAPMPSPGDSGMCGRLVPVSALSFQDLPAAPGARLRVRAEAVKGAPATPWLWRVVYGDGAGVDVATTSLDAQGSVAELPLEKAGRYRLSAATDLGGVPCTLNEIAYAVQTDRRLAQFRIRLVPPSGLPFPTQESAVQAQAGVPLTQPVVLQRGAEVVLDPHDASGSGGVSSYVRVTETRSALTIEGHTDSLPFKALLLASFAYDVLFVPDGDVAPLLQTAKTPAALNVLPLVLTPGTAVSGRALGAGGQPVRDVRVVLRAGALTSTVGASDAAGGFALRSRGGTFALAVSPPSDAGLPELALAATPGLPIPDAASAGSLEIRWAPVTAASVTLSVRAPDGIRPAAGARARLDRDGVLPAAGTVTFHPPAGPALTRTLEGLAHAVGQVAADGTVTLSPLPPGRYRLTVTPADGDDSSALTATTVDLGGAAPAPVRLSAKVHLRGTLQPAAIVPGTRVYATPRVVDPPRPLAAAVVGADGSYDLAVDPGRGVARSLLAAVSSGVTGSEVPPRTLPRALAFTSVVTGEGAQAVGAVVVQAFCDAASPSCLDPTLPLAETLSGPGGAFTMPLPDPGSF
jgi:hypothetical protein